MAVSSSSAKIIETELSRIFPKGDIDYGSELHGQDKFNSIQITVRSINDEELVELAKFVATVNDNLNIQAQGNSVAIIFS